MFCSSTAAYPLLHGATETNRDGYWVVEGFTGFLAFYCGTPAVERLFLAMRRWLASFLSGYTPQAGRLKRS